MTLKLVAFLEEKLKYLKLQISHGKLEADRVKVRAEATTQVKLKNYLSIRIFQFGLDFIHEAVAERACALTSDTRHKRVAEAILFAELIWLDLSDLGKEKRCIVVHQLSTLQRDENTACHLSRKHSTVL
jgi:hypothetical protein